VVRFYTEQDRQEAAFRKESTQAKPGVGKVGSGKFPAPDIATLPHGIRQDRAADLPVVAVTPPPPKSALPPRHRWPAGPSPRPAR